MGPTEFRLLGIVVIALIMYVTPIRTFTFHSLSIFDIVAVILIVVLAIMLVVSFLSDAREYAKMEPLKRNGEK